MNHQNHWYGHAHVLARYAGVTGRPPRIWGYLQHGWNVHDGYGADDSPPEGAPRLVWSDAPRRRGWLAGAHNYRVIGAPFAYLLAMTPEPAKPRKRRGTIYYPFHGWEAQAVFGDHRRLAAEIAEREEPPVTICLYWVEHRYPQIREVYESFGFRVITHGRRGGYQNADPRFLDRQLAELRRHRRVASNRLGTALLYGAAAGCEVGVYGDEMLIENEHPAYGGNARIRRLWPQLHTPVVPPAVSAAFAAEELGQRHVAGPAELADLLGWSDVLDNRHRLAG
ncbi:MAG: hypothetical protein WCA46_29905 [Actinocatenispora sp.]